MSEKLSVTNHTHRFQKKLGNVELFLAETQFMLSESGSISKHYKVPWFCIEGTVECFLC